MKKTPTIECNKCAGTGKVFGCEHVMGGVCFSCNGRGIKRKQTYTKVEKTMWLVTCEGIDYPLQKSEEEARQLARDVTCMHLEPVKTYPKKVRSYVSKPALV